MTLEPQPPQRPVVRHSDEVFRVTSAHTALSEEQRARTKRYLISMGIRTACFIGVIFTEGWIRWVLVVGALLLPYIAVVMANAGRENDEFTQEPIDLRGTQESITTEPSGQPPDPYR